MKEDSKKNYILILFYSLLMICSILLLLENVEELIFYYAVQLWLVTAWQILLQKDVSFIMFSLMVLIN